MAPPTEHKPSLPQLLALDKDYESFERRLQQAARLAGIRSDILDSNEIASATFAKGPTQSRAEWVLRWLLDKLRAQDDAGKKARASSRSWTLLKELVLSVPMSNASRLLNSNQVLSIVQTTLEENQMVLRGLLPGSRQRDVRWYWPEDLETSDSSTTVDGYEAVSKKRKRWAESSPSQRRIIDGYHPGKLLEVIGAFIIALVDLSRSSSSEINAVASEHIKSVLRLDTARASRLLSLWLSAIHAASTMEPSSSSVAPALAIWGMRSVDAEGPDVASAAFCADCLIPALKLHDTLKTRSSTQKATETLLEQIASLEALFAKHLLLPARAFFHAASRTEGFAETYGHTRLRSYLEPLKIELQQAKGTANFTNLSRKLVYGLFSEAIKLSPRSSPRQKSAEVPWIEAVIDGLLECTGEPTLDSSTFLSYKYGLSPLVPMLQLAQKSDIKLSKDFLKKILDKYSGLSDVFDAASPTFRPETEANFAPDPSKEGPPLRWTLISQVLKLNGSLFLDERIAGNDELLLTALLKAISATEWSVLPGEGCGAYHKGSDWWQWVNSFHSVAHDIIIPLMETFIGSRNLGGFLSLWHEQAASHAQRARYCFPWLSDKIAPALRQHLESSMTVDQIKYYLDVFSKPIANLNSDLEDPILRDRVAASVLVVDAILGSIVQAETIQKLKSTLLSSQLPMPDCSVAKWQFSGYIWSILRRRQEFSRITGIPETFNGGVALHSPCALETVTSAIRWALEEEGLEEDGFVEYFEGRLDVSLNALLFVTVLCSKVADSPDSAKLAQKTIAEAVEPFQRVLSWDHGVTPYWAYRIFSACLVALSETPRSLLLLASEPRQQLFENISILRYPASEKLREATGDAVLLAASNTVRDEYLDALIKCIRPSGWDLSLKAAIKQLQKFPSAAIPRRSRERILDALLTCSVDCSHPIAADMIPEILNLMVRLLEFSSPGAKMCTDAETLFAFCKTLDARASFVIEGDGSLRLLDKLFSGIFQHIEADAALDRSREFVRSFNAAFEKVFTKGSSSSDEKAASFLKAPVTLAMVKTWLQTLCRIPGSPEITPQYRKVLSSDFEHLAANVDDDKLWTPRRAVFFAVLDFPKVFLPEGSIATTSSRPRLQAVEPKLDLDVARLYPSEDGKDSLKTGKSSTEVGAEFAKFMALLPATDEEIVILRQALKLLNLDLPPAERAAIDESLQLRPLNDTRGYAEIDWLMEQAEQKRDAGYLKLLGIILKRKDAAPPGAATDGSKALLPKLCGYMKAASTIADFGASISCIDIILREKPWLITQYAIDTLLTTLTALASPTSPSLPPEHALFIHTHLTRTATTLVSLHRKRLGGRMHLLVPLLQALLTCLFTQHRYATARTRLAHPPWLSEPLPVGAATAYTRLLTTLCDPTVSSATAHRRRAGAELVDETKRARQYVGEFVGYVLMQYCTCQLGGTMESEVREVLRPGLWAMMDVVRMEGMRAMNAGMGKDERVLWGAMYSEWRRFGRWRGK
ncbi:hypothetical protein EJ06DRAFT_583451 [Trichodelitschia bisporula]|uniref:Nucleolar 27S pre-rRNA processing Urb2/Npa2 C-terminal domain-containing protein n=1 Tax=Trichodelitschia bisporula TaxID=703511 RepID=A0A6G1HS31_9PEZI|nr:hypothetical protein EJ06DRAFT_583451 [Trichodelitschia bisporula]